MNNSTSKDPVFTRGDVAKILNVSPLTIANREKSKKYPQPNRDINGYRIYTLNDVFNLQLLTFRTIDQKPIISILYDKGFRDHKQIASILDAAMAKRQGN